ncbi:trifunctional histidinol dehydrogenase [Knufia fluminis]|uniref:Histidine biosynthesis trifunctional protein n=1 Tax=Knufia fluminis TaxID=191047 RepID=A0AAN8EBX6_9EURO|nr:trifunctional histidinol dehydrogenase [Knufia fluminis]
MVLGLLPSVELSTSSSVSTAAGLTLDQVSYLGSCLIDVDHDSLPDALQFLRQNFNKLEVHADVRRIASLDEVFQLLHAGARRVFVTFEQLKVLSSYPEDQLAPGRLVLTIAPDPPMTNLQKLKSWLAENPYWKTAPWAFDGDRGSEYVDAVLAELENSPPHADQTIWVMVTDKTLNEDVLSRYPGSSYIVSAGRLTLDPSKEGHDKLIPVTDMILAGAVPDRKTGLYTTTVVDERGIALGLVYSSKQSISEALRTGTGVYQSRKRGLWYKGQSSGDTQELISLDFDCDKDCLLFRVRQRGRGFCHLGTMTCWGPDSGLAKLERTIKERKQSAPEGSYTKRLFNDPKLINAKIREEADELCEAQTKDEIASEAADLLYFALTRCIAADVSLSDVERSLDLKSLRAKPRRKGDAKPQYLKSEPSSQSKTNGTSQAEPTPRKEEVKEAASRPKEPSDPAGTAEDGRIQMKRYSTTQAFSQDTIESALQRPSQRSTEKIMSLVQPIIADVQAKGDSAVLKYTHKFEKATSLKSPVLKAPFPASLMQLPPETIEAIDVSYNNILTFHSAQKEEKPLIVETMPGVTCSRFSRPIEKVGLYIPGGTAVLPSTALMLGVPAMAAGCKNIVMASPPRSDGTISPEIVYIAHKVGAEAIVLAGGAQAVAAMAYGTASITKVDKILGPGNQFVTAAKMIVSNDTTASVSIDMPAGPSEVLVIADKTANPAFVASDLLSQAEHGVDSQVVLLAVDLSEDKLQAIEDELHAQAHALPRVDIVRGAIDHSVSISVPDLATALKWSNHYAPEHLILQIEDPHATLSSIQHAGSVFIGQWTPESVGDYSAGVNHSLPTYGYAKQYSGVNLASFMKHITSSAVTEEGVKSVGRAVVELARCEGLDAHKRAMELRMEALGLLEPKVKKAEPTTTTQTQNGAPEPTSGNTGGTAGASQGFDTAADDIDDNLPSKTASTSAVGTTGQSLEQLPSTKTEQQAVEENKVALEAGDVDGQRRTAQTINAGVAPAGDINGQKATNRLHQGGISMAE